MPKMLTISEVAEALGLKPATIRSWIWKRQIGYVKVSRAVRIPADELRRLIEGGTRPAVRSLRPHVSTGKDRG
jgi:excisionase family DNA binding protein